MDGVREMDIIYLDGREDFGTVSITSLLIKLRNAD